MSTTNGNSTNDGTTGTAGTTTARWEADRRRRDDGDCLSDHSLDRLQAGELGADEAASVKAHLSRCAGCAGAAAALDTHRQQFLAQDLSALAADALARAGATAPVVATRAARWRFLLPVFGVGLAAAGALLLVPGLREAAAPGETADDTFRSKGGLSLSLYVQHPEESGEGKLHTGEALHPGDKLRFKVSSERAGHLTVLAVDQQGTVSVFHPQRGSAETASAALAPIAARSEGPLPTAVELDDTLGEEILVAVRCAEPRPVAEVVAAARAAFTGKQGAGTAPAAGPLALPCAEARYRITKTGPAGAAPAKR